VYFQKRVLLNDAGNCQYHTASIVSELNKIMEHWWKDNEKTEPK